MNDGTGADSVPYNSIHVIHFSPCTVPCSSLTGAPLVISLWRVRHILEMLAAAVAANGMIIEKRLID